MAEVRASIEIHAPRKAVWGVVTDLPRLGEWVTIHAGFEGSPPSSVEEGTRFTQKLEVADKDFDVEWSATEVSEPELLEGQGEGPGGSAARARYPATRRPPSPTSQTSSRLEESLVMRRAPWSRVVLTTRLTTPSSA
jgi:uncharacterized protein YndB with AHSA1/START domain